MIYVLQIYCLLTIIASVCFVSYVSLVRYVAGQPTDTNLLRALIVTLLVFSRPLVWL